jgi:hypothetical protein
MFHRHARLYVSFSWVLVAIVVFLAVGANTASAVTLLLVAATAPPLLMLSLWKDGPSPAEAISEVMHSGDSKRSFRNPNATS